MKKMKVIVTYEWDETDYDEMSDEEFEKELDDGVENVQGSSESVVGVKVYVDGELKREKDCKEEG